jgi:hypothetical protein
VFTASIIRAHKILLKEVGNVMVGKASTKCFELYLKESSYFKFFKTNCRRKRFSNSSKDSKFLLNRKLPTFTEILVLCSKTDRDGHVMSGATSHHFTAIMN